MVAATEIGFVRMRVEDSDQRQEGESAEAVLMRRALTTPPMTVTKAER
jgi:hypothetical protein